MNYYFWILTGLVFQIYSRSGGYPQSSEWTSDYDTWFTARGAIRIAHYDVTDDVI